MGVEGEQSGAGAIEPVGEQRMWLPLPNESAQAYTGFRAYIDLPREERTITKAYRALKGDGKARTWVLLGLGVKVQLA